MVSILTARDNVVDCYHGRGAAFCRRKRPERRGFRTAGRGRTAYAGTVGNDVSGAISAMDLTAEGVSTDFLQGRPRQHRVLRDRPQ